MEGGTSSATLKETLWFPLSLRFLLVFFFLLFFFSTFATQPVHSQSQEGFISIDCGNPDGADYEDPSTKITFSPDSRYINRGENKIVSNNPFSRKYETLRSFPNGDRNCYKLWPVQTGKKYLIRAGFWYGNYDKRRNVPTFDLHIGVNFWTTVRLLGDFLWVCLINTGKGTPFISTLELRPLPDFMYPIASLSQHLVYESRKNFGATYQYPDDPYDRIWFNASTNFRTFTGSIELAPKVGDRFQVPSKVMATAVIGSVLLRIDGDPGDRVYVVMHFTELETLNSTNDTRLISVYGGLPEGWLYDKYSPPFGDVDHKEVINVSTGSSGRSSLFIYSSISSTRPPLVNAIETYFLRRIKGLPTQQGDVEAIQEIKQLYNVTRNWQGDPCSPKEYVWDGVGCNYYENSSPPRITSLNMASSKLSGIIPPSIANLTALVILDLSNNDFTGIIPDFLAELSSLKLVNLSGNIQPISIPKNLCGKLSRIEGNVECKNLQGNIKRKIIIIVPTILFIIIVFIIISIIIRRTRRRKLNPSIKRNFPIGKGGFGIVYLGYLHDETQVAVKVLSLSSFQGIKEFQAEALLLSRVHHINLVSLIGYCDDKQHLALVYEYMDGGTICDLLSGESNGTIVLSWEQRLKIALDAAQGLDYLHNGCRPSIIHRDVKSTNILLNRNLVAKLGDFGLSKAFNVDSFIDISTIVAGSPGYLDPEYHRTSKLTKKSDVYSFGIVLLELITGQRPFVISSNNMHIIQWVHQRLENGHTDDIVDSRIHDSYNINSIWKAIEIAMDCTLASSTKRLNMSDVVMRLKQCLQSEAYHEVLRNTKGPYQDSLEILPFNMDTTNVPIAR
ncbi:unnamed protein product [Spirodela intermedia]|uniref:Protein kinase domain-containing protein n=1 Tax=Spirodela intermedia TaxID=51605 RepID=A0A7I8JDP5_SPIIN|nr:unnamed protein product [Spirodela intermedia]CAA6667502.1 unnamed protein product [Spirodela intermedia]